MTPKTGAWPEWFSLAAGGGFFASLVSPAGGLSKNSLDIYVHFCYNYCMGH